MISGRPLAGEYADYAADDIAYVEGDDAVAALEAQSRVVLDTMNVDAPAYAPGKWTLKEIFGHLVDDERILQYRALCVARNEPLPLPGFDENAYVAATRFEARSLESLADEYRAVRNASIAFFSNLGEDEWLRRGIVNGYEASVRGLAFHICGHELHHLRVIRTKYL